jgi:bifunctional non-homologous end joining protein LigD
MSDLPFIDPCIPILRKVPPIGPEWTHEPKFDGWRVQILKRGRDVRILTRRGNDITRRLPDLAGAMMDLPRCIIDGELVCSTARSPCDFDALASVMRRKAGGDLSVWAFDLLRIDGRDIRHWPLHRRKARLARLLDGREVPRLVEGFDDGAALLGAVELLELEGVVSKRLDSPYTSGPSQAWIKSKSVSWRERNRERWRAFQKS